jgi:hypothetical protein
LSSRRIDGTYIDLFQCKPRKILVVYYVSVVHDRVMMCTENFRGLWTRSLLAWPNGRSDTTTQVGWLQGISLFVDLRQPAGHALRLSAASCRDELTQDDCLALAAQQGFSGRFEARDAAHEWVRRIDYQPPRATRDIGRLFWRGEIMVEEGVEADYTEHWHLHPTLPALPCAGFSLHDAARGVFGCLLRVGDRFAYARGRAEPLAGTSLTALVQGADSLRQMQALVDCEISQGEVREEGWRITRSSLPYKVGAAFGMQPEPGQRVAVADMDEAGRTITRLWEVAAEEGDGSAILETPVSSF